MANIPRVPGPTPPRGPRESREPVKPGTDKFKEYMKPKEAGSEQEKRRQQKEEFEIEKKAKPAQQPIPEEADNIEPLPFIPKKPEKTPPHVKVGEPEKKDVKPVKIPKEIPEPEEEGTLPPPVPEKRGTLEPKAPEQEKALPSQPLPEKKVEPEKALPKERNIEEQAPLPPPPSGEEPEAETRQFREEKKPAPIEKEKKKEEKPSTELPITSGLGPLFIPPTTESAPAYTLLKPEALALFEKMVSQIVVMHTNGVTETTFHLDTPEFASSPFAGARIIIREFSTAPLSYNIEFIGTPENIQIFNQNVASLRAAFDSEKRMFTVNRIEGRLAEREEGRKPRVERKEETSGGEGETL